MKIKIIVIIISSAIILSACGGVTPYPTPTLPSPTSILPTTPLSTMTSTPTITPTFENTPTPETLYGYPTPEAAVWPTCVPMMDCLQLTPNVQRQDILFHQLYVGKYVLRSWCNIDPQFPSFSPCAITISSKSNKQIEIWGYPAYFREETGSDLTGDGRSDIVITDWGGGNCCVGTIVYEVGDNLKKIMDIGSFRPGTFIDLNGDGSYEYIALDRIWSPFKDCLCEKTIQTVYEDQGSLGYILATHKFKNQLKLDIDVQKYMEILSNYKKRYPNTLIRFDNLNTTNTDYDSAVRSLYNIIVDYLLMNQKGDALKILNEYCPPDKVSEYMADMQNYMKYFLAP